MPPPHRIFRLSYGLVKEGDLGQITIDEEDYRSSWPLETLIFTVFLPLIISKLGLLRDIYKLQKIFL